MHSSKWLNTCIGSANYGYFLGVVFSVSTLTSEAIALSLALMVTAIYIIHTYMQYINNILGVCIDVQIISFADSDKLLYSYDQNAYENNPDISLLALQVPHIHTYIHYIILTKLHAYILTCCTYCLYRVRVFELLQLLYLCIHTYIHTYIHIYNIIFYKTSCIHINVLHILSI